VALDFESPKMFVQHPIQDRADEKMYEIADKAFDDVVSLVLDSDPS